MLWVGASAQVRARARWTVLPNLTTTTRGLQRTTVSYGPFSYSIVT